MPEFSLDLSDEQKQLRDWVHGFAAATVRPVAAEWDQREETPWPVIREAAKVDTAGLVAGPKLRKLGMRASHTADVFLDDVRVPGRCLLGGKEALPARSNVW